MKEEMRKELRSVEFALNCFETKEKRKGNPQAIAGLPPCQWDLPEDVKSLYDLQWELASELYCLGDWSPQPGRSTDENPTRKTKEK